MVKVSEYTYAELAQQRLNAADHYRRRATIQKQRGNHNHVRTLLDWAGAEEIKARKFMKYHREVTTQPA